MIWAVKRQKWKTRFCLGYVKRALNLKSLKVESRKTLLNIPAISYSALLSVDVLESLLELHLLEKGE